MATTKPDRMQWVAAFMASERGREFEVFWKAYPRRIGKFDAMVSYDRARTMATAEEILAGVSGYCANKPDYAEWCHPATFLNQGRWLDEYDAPAVAKPKPAVVIHFRKDA